MLIGSEVIFGFFCFHFQKSEPFVTFEFDPSKPAFPIAVPFSFLTFPDYLYASDIYLTGFYFMLA